MSCSRKRLTATSVCRHAPRYTSPKLPMPMRGPSSISVASISHSSAWRARRARSARAAGLRRAGLPRVGPLGPARRLECFDGADAHLNVAPCASALPLCYSPKCATLLQATQGARHLRGGMQVRPRSKVIRRQPGRAQPCSARQRGASRAHACCSAFPLRQPRAPQLVGACRLAP